MPEIVALGQVDEKPTRATVFTPGNQSVQRTTELSIGAVLLAMLSVSTKRIIPSQVCPCRVIQRRQRTLAREVRIEQHHSKLRHQGTLDDKFLGLFPCMVSSWTENNAITPPRHAAIKRQRVSKRTLFASSSHALHTAEPTSSDIGMNDGIDMVQDQQEAEQSSSEPGKILHKERQSLVGLDVAGRET